MRSREQRAAGGLSASVIGVGSGGRRAYAMKVAGRSPPRAAGGCTSTRTSLEARARRSPLAISSRREAEPQHAELLAHPLALVAHEVDHDHRAAGPHHARHLAKRVGRRGQVLEHHVREGGVDLAVGERQRRRPRPRAARRRRAGCRRACAARGVEHARRVVDRDHAQAEPRELERERAGAGADVGDARSRGHQAGEGARAQQVVVPHLAQRVPLGADGVEEASGCAPRAPRARAPARAVALGRARRGRARAAPRPTRRAPGPVGREREAVEHVGAVAPIAHQAGLAQDPEVPRDPGLRHAEHLHQLLHGQLLALEQGQDPDPGRIAERPEDLLEQRRCSSGCHPSGNPAWTDANGRSGLSAMGISAEGH